MLNNKSNIRPDIEGEMDELQRVSQDLKRDEDIDLSVDEIIKSFKDSNEEILTHDVWIELENTESNEIEEGDWDKVMDVAKTYKKTNPKKLKKVIQSGEYERPLILKLGNRYILVAGNTRLCTAAAMGVNPKVFIGHVDKNINEKWSEKYKRSIDCNNPKGFSQRAHCQGKKKKMEETEILKGGLADKMSLGDIAQKHKVDIKDLTKQFLQGVKIEMEHTDSKNKASEIAMDHLSEDPKYYTKLKKVEAKETTGADSAGSYNGPAFGKTILKKDIHKIHNMDISEEEVMEVTDASSSGSYDVPLFGKSPKGRKNPLKIDGPESVKKSRAVQDKNFPKFGGPGGIFIKVKEKCKKFPYCNQGDINAIEVLKETISDVSKETGIPKSQIEKLVLNQIKEIFIKYEND